MRYCSSKLILITLKIYMNFESFKNAFFNILSLNGSTKELLHEENEETLKGLVSRLSEKPLDGFATML